MQDLSGFEEATRCFEAIDEDLGSAGALQAWQSLPPPEVPRPDAPGVRGLWSGC